MLLSDCKINILMRMVKIRNLFCCNNGHYNYENMNAEQLIQDGYEYRDIQNKEEDKGPIDNSNAAQSIPLGSVLDKLGVPQERQLKPDALQLDIRLGWVPRSQITGPIPLSFSQESFDWVIESKNECLLYLGYRPATTFDLHQRYYGEGKNYSFHQFHLCKSQFLQRFFRKHYAQYSFEGREPQTIKDTEISFNSFYEGGNLDAVYFQQNEYRLMLRVDSNTLGHCNYYNFIVRPSKSGKAIFRIMNINKWKSLYERGLKPYVRKIKKDSSSQFIQSAQNIHFGISPLNQQFGLRLKSLKFQFFFDEANVDYQFSYSIPYTYSDLLCQIRRIKQQCLHIGKLCHSLSGVEVPLLTVTAPDRQSSNEAYAVVIIGRVHPSEATGSHIVNGLIRNLVSDSPETRWIRQKVVFKIIPMLNPDGVILGNTRTGVAGKDLNRQYRKNNEFVFPEVIAIIDYITKLREKYGKRLLFVIDVHGHSSRKNSFFYGPQFSIIDEEYIRCRMLPRFYAARTEVFRYHSCKYKVASFKQSTARGYFNGLGVRTYTHETSAYCFFDFLTRKDKAFTRQTLQQLGKQLLLSIHDYVKQTIGKVVSLPPIPDQKIVKKGAQRAQNQIEDQDSQKMSSDKDDSEDDIDDFQEKKLFQFFRKINQNRQYFYEQLLALQNNHMDANEKHVTGKQQKKQKKIELMKTEEIKKIQNNRQSNIESQLVVRKNNEIKIDWATKVTYPQKKRQLQQYTKISNVIFGSTIPQHYFQSASTQNVDHQDPFHASYGQSTKYSINYIEAQFKANQTKYPLPEPKIYKNLKGFKKQRSFKQLFQFKQISPTKLEIAKNAYDKERYLKLKQQIIPEIKHSGNRVHVETQKSSSSKPGQYESVRQLPIFALELKQSSEKSNQQQQIMRMTNSLKVLTRKKSIRNIRESEDIQNKRISKSLKNSTLGKKLPSLGTLYFNK